MPRAATTNGPCCTVAAAPGCPPAGTWYREVPGTVVALTFTPSEFCMTVATRDGGATVTLTLTADVTSPAASLTNISIASAAQFDPITGNNIATVAVTPQQADLAVSTGVNNASPTVNEIITYTVTISNNGVVDIAVDTPAP